MYQRVVLSSQDELVLRRVRWWIFFSDWEWWPRTVYRTTERPRTQPDRGDLNRADNFFIRIQTDIGVRDLKVKAHIMSLYLNCFVYSCTTGVKSPETDRLDVYSLHVYCGNPSIAPIYNNKILKFSNFDRCTPTESHYINEVENVLVVCPV